MINAYKKIIIPTRPHSDVIVAIFLLIKFGEFKYPGVKNAIIDTWQELPAGDTSLSLEEKGVLLLDIGKGKFDHHNTNKNLSQLVAEDLGILADTSIKKILYYAERDDKYGKGTISSDPLDKAFGLSGLVAALNKTIKDPQEVVRIILPLIEAHHIEETRRTQELPKEFEEKLKEGKAKVFQVKQGKKDLKVVILESDNLSMAGWLKSSNGLKADVVCQRNSEGFTNVITKPLKNIDLRWPSAYLRKAEAELRERKLFCSTFDLMKPGKIEGVPEWYYDTATNSVLNGGASPKGILPTAISLETIIEILKESLAQEPPR